MGESLDLRPQTVDIDVYEGDAWSVQVSVPTLGDLTGSTITARFQDNTGTPPIDLDLALTDLPGSKFTVGQLMALTSGRYDVQITLPASLPRTYIVGRLNVSERVD